MQTKVFDWSLAEHPLRISFLYPFTRYKLKPLPMPAEGENYDIAVSLDLFERGRAILGPENSDSFVEYRCLIALSSRFLLRYNACVFHAVAFSWRGFAWLLTAPSGTGKSTQYLNWRRLFPGEIRMISGDMPILEARGDGSVWVHPSSWNGKERLFGASAAPLGGIVFLEQGQEDRILNFPPEEFVIPLLKQFILLPETKDEIQAQAFLLERMLLAAPCCKMVNLGGDASTRLLRDTLSGFLEREVKN